MSRAPRSTGRGARRRDPTPPQVGIRARFNGASHPDSEQITLEELTDHMPGDAEPAAVKHELCQVRGLGAEALSRGAKPHRTRRRTARPHRRDRTVLTSRPDEPPL
ncbi:hypothetical protein ACFYZ8_17295 [Streptomyces sp. NPDC001668]|uniref:hypothetical protein n=1 Tax=unclassified Streptomyces TaxID=2593676 RepID=UPI0036A9EA8B